MARPTFALGLLLAFASACAQENAATAVEERGASSPDAAAASTAASTGLSFGFVPGQRTLVGAFLDWANLTSSLGEADPACALSVQQKYNCSETGCEDLVPGYINYLDFFYCDTSDTAGQVFAFVLLLIWMTFLLQLVESTTNDFFCASLTLAVDALKLSPNVAGVTFLAVGNAACDVIASIAAFATNSPKVGVGTTLGAGIFVTCAVIAVVSFVSDVRLARRSFVRDVLFFIITVVYLLVVSLDGIITLGESVGFIVIYIVFVGIVAGGRYIRMLRGSEDEGGKDVSTVNPSLLGVTGDEGASRRLSQEIIDKAAIFGTGDDAASAGGAGSAALLLSAGAGGYNADAVAAAAGLTADGGASGGAGAAAAAASGHGHADVHFDMLAALDAARSASVRREREKSEASRISRSNRFAAPATPSPDEDEREAEDADEDDDDDEDEDEEEEEDDGGDLGGGSGDVSARIEAPSEEDGGMGVAAPSSGSGPGSGRKGRKSKSRTGGGSFASAGGAGGRSKTGSFLEDLPKKPSRWTRQFLKTQKDAAPAFAPFQWTKYHKKHLAAELGKRLRARGASRITTPDGRTVDFLQLLARDPAAAGELAAAIGTAVTAAAQSGERVLSYEEAAAAARSGAAAGLAPLAGRKLSAATASSATSTTISSGSGGISAAAVGAGASAPLLTASASSASSAAPSRTSSAADFLTVLPHETVKPIADCYVRLKKVVGCVYPYWHGFMHIAELPVTVARKLTVPVMHEGAYRRRLLCLVMPFSVAFFTLILTTHILKGSGNTASGFPLWVIGFIVGGVVGGVLHFTLPVRKGGHGAAGAGGAAGSDNAVGDSAQASQSLLAAGPKDAGAHKEGAALVANAPAHGHGHGHGHAHAGQKKRPWYKRVGIAIAGPNDHPLPRGPVFAALLVASFLLALFWLLVIANEIVGTAIFIGKVLHVPDVVMGLTVLAVGNSINDLAASLTIARDGYASMAVAGAYAGPMFNVLAGIGLPMLLATAKAESQSYAIGKPTLLVWLSYGALLTSLTVTLVWVPFEKWRITHRIGRFLCFWFFLFIFLVIVLGFSGVSKDDAVSLAG